MHKICVYAFQSGEIYYILRLPAFYSYSYVSVCVYKDSVDDLQLLIENLQLRKQNWRTYCSRYSLNKVKCKSQCFCSTCTVSDNYRPIWKSARLVENIVQLVIWCILFSKSASDTSHISNTCDRPDMWVIESYQIWICNSNTLYTHIIM